MKFKSKIIIFILLILSANLLSAEVYRSRAVVSYYAGDFHGKKTSNGEYFNMNALTCASKSLPFDTILKVTNLANGLSVQVRVNDRGPFVPGRELDLSKAAAVKLDMIKSGTANVKIEIVKMGPNTKLSQQTAAKAAKIMEQRFPGQTAAATGSAGGGSSPKAVAKPRPEGTFWDIQVGAFSTREAANKLAQKLLKAGFKEVVFQKGNDIYRVVIRNVPAKEVAAMEKKLISAGYSDYVIRQRKQ